MTNQALWKPTTVGVNDDRRTPKSLFNKLDTYFHFDVDAAAIKENALCDTFITPEQDSLKQDWSAFGSSIWCNPPYGRVIPQWIAHANHFQHLSIVFLLPARTDTKWFYDACKEYWDIVLLHGRVTFEPHKTSPNFGSCLLVRSSLVDGTSVWDWKNDPFVSRTIL